MPRTIELSVPAAKADAVLQRIGDIDGVVGSGSTGTSESASLFSASSSSPAQPPCLMPKKDPLAAYRAQRDFRSTTEPTGQESVGTGVPCFVVQKHDASALHYDFRLEVDGVLKSWAVPKGPSTDPTTKRLAQPTEDHPLAYADFEGVIPSGYGAGAVIVWDRGTYRNLREGVSMPQALEEGKVEILLEGEKLRGGYTLVRMKGRDAWLLIKKDDSEADGRRDVLATEPASVLSGRTIEQVRGAPPKSSEPSPVDTGESLRRPGASSRMPSADASAADSSRPASRTRHQTEARESAIRIGRVVELSNLDRVLFPDCGLTKNDLVSYYRRIADRMLPYLRERPLTLYRYPQGIEEGGFVQQQASEYFPDWIARATLDRATPEGEARAVTHAVCNDAATLVYLANQNVVTPHVWLSRLDRPHRPDRMVFDLDPSGDPSGDPFEPVRRAARAVYALFDEIGLPAFVMTTGSTGLHLVTPLDRSADFDAVRGFANALAAVLADRHPDLVTTEHRKAKRRGRVYLDTLRNAYGQTAVPPYAVRALPGAPVATPLTWEELGRPGLHARRYTVENLFRRLGQLERDPWAELGRSALALVEPAHRLDAIRRKEA